MQTTNSLRRTRALAALAWMTCGLFLLLTPLAWPGRVFGFSTPFWLIGAPLCVLLGLQPRLPLRLLTPARTSYRQRNR